jgi:AmmeMemoRadiSam system protein A
MTQPSAQLTAAQQQFLLKLARRSIEHGVTHGAPVSAPHTDDPALDADGACFVTLTSDGELRGCIGSLEAHRSLVLDVCENAFSAAFRDPRFPPVTADELPLLHIEISVLGSLEEMHFRDEADLLRQIVPGRDGLVLEYGRHRGTFLPLVWEQLPDKQGFWHQLKRKAGLPTHFWADTLRCYRYETFVFEE